MSLRTLEFCGLAMLLGCSGSSSRMLVGDGSAASDGGGAQDHHVTSDTPSAGDSADAKASEAKRGDGTSDGGSPDRFETGTQPDTGDVAACGTLANTASPITATLVASIPLTAGGGPLTDGTYELVSAEETISSASAKFWRIFQIANGGTTFQWVVQDIGLPPELRFSGSIQATGTSLTLTDNCLAGALRPYPYDAQGTTLNLYFLVAAGGRVFHYRARSGP